MGFARLKATLVAVITCALSANALIPNYASPAEANADFGRRLAEVVKGQVNSFKTQRESPSGIGDWNTREEYGLRSFASGLYAFANPAKFSEIEFSALSGLSNVSLIQHRDAFLAKFRVFSKTMNVNKPVGTSVKSKEPELLPTSGARDIDDGAQPWFHWDHSPGELYSKQADFDMSLKEIATVIYAFIDRPDVLPNDILTQLVTLNTSEPTIPYTGQSTQLSGVRSFTWVAVSQPETENHCLMIFQWQFLMNNLVKWIAGLDSKHPRYNLAIKKYYDASPTRYNSSAAFGGWLVQSLTRISRRGLFETNARAYESFSFSAIMNLAANADLLFSSDPISKNVAMAARNAADYLAANYAFLSYKGKRNLSRRRNWEPGLSAGTSKGNTCGHL